jgi:hypothetical protein
MYNTVLIQPTTTIENNYNLPSKNKNKQQFSIPAYSQSFIVENASASFSPIIVGSPPNDFLINLKKRMNLYCDTVQKE